MSGGQVVTWMEWRAERARYDEVIGVDEAGRGALAGPVLVGAWSLPAETRPLDSQWILRLRDSKQLSPKVRAWLRDRIDNAPYASSFGSSSANQVDKYGISEAVARAAQVALYRVWTPKRRHIPVLFDGTSGNWLNMRSWLSEHFDNWFFLEKADTHDRAVMGASVVAKTRHDYEMEMLVANRFGQDPWNWRQNQGYGTKEHIAAIKGEAGASGDHRMSFAPMKYLYGN